MIKQKKHFVIYQITNNINGKIYIGKHETFNIDDDYFGSGTIIQAAIKKYGIENFTKTILIELQNVEELNLLESLVVNSEFCKRSDVYNINVGGDGGWYYVNNESDFAIGSSRRLEKFHKPGGIACQKKYKDEYGSFTAYVLNKMTDEQKIKYRHKLLSNFKKFREEHPDFCCGEQNGMYGKIQTENTKQKISDIMKTESNKMRGKHWYKDPNSKACRPYYEGEQPAGWIRGKYATDNEYNAGKKHMGTVWITDVITHKNRMVRKDKAKELVLLGEWQYGHTQKPMSKQGKQNIRASQLRRSYKYHKPKNKNKQRYVNTVTGKRIYLDDNDKIPDGYVKSSKSRKHKKYTTNSCLSVSKAMKHNEWLKETQDMADYFSEYGYEETCKKFNVNMSIESMMMRFIRARKLYGIVFKSQPGKKRKFKPIETK